MFTQFLFFRAPTSTHQSTNSPTRPFTLPHSPAIPMFVFSFYSPASIRARSTQSVALQLKWPHSSPTISVSRQSTILCQESTSSTTRNCKVSRRSHRCRRFFSTRSTSSSFSPTFIRCAFASICKSSPSFPSILRRCEKSSS